MLIIAIIFGVVLFVIMRICLLAIAHKFNLNIYKLQRMVISLELPFVAISLIYTVITKKYMNGLLLVIIAAIIIAAFITVMIIINDGLDSSKETEKKLQAEKQSAKYESLVKENELLRSELAKIKKPIKSSILSAINEIGEK